MFLSIFILVIPDIDVLTLHSHLAFLVVESYPLKVQLLSHKDKLLFTYSLCLSLRIKSVPLSEVEVVQISL